MSEEQIQDALEAYLLKRRLTEIPIRITRTDTMRTMFDLANDIQYTVFKNDDRWNPKPM